MDSFVIDVRDPVLTCHPVQSTDDAISDFDRGRPDEEVVASPNGSFIANAPGHGAPIVLIDSATLASRKLGHQSDSLSHTPVAWSADSRYLAFAPPDDGKLYIYDVRQQTIVSAKPPTGGEIAVISWSPDGTQLAVFALHNRRMSLDPLSLLIAFSGHPNFFNDGILHVYRLAEDQPRSIVLKRAIPEIGSPNVRLDWAP